jgi:signal transduction histidine kinase
MARILVIDDDGALRDVIRLSLEDAGFEVVEAEDGETGVQQACTRIPDLILCDVRMEKMDGYRTLEALRKHSNTALLPFILMTGQADHAGLRQGMELGADDYLPKPFTVPQLLAAVEARLKKQQTLREQAEQRLTELRANISRAVPHELLTPLTGILGFSEILITDHASLQPCDIVSMAEAIRDSAKRLNRLIENILLIAQMELLPRGQPLRPGSTQDARQAIETVALRLATQAGRLEDLTLDLEGAAVAIAEDCFVKLVEELVDNALKFSNAGSQVRVTAGLDRDCLTLKVADRGRGMRPEHIAQVGAYMQFERRFYEQQGSGLGLTIAKRLAELHGGTLDIQSEVGVETVVEVRLPSPPNGRPR